MSERPQVPRLEALTLPDVRTALVWRFSSERQTLSSASIGGGLSPARWLVNAQVDLHFARTDLAQIGTEIAGSLGLRGPGQVLLTAATVDANSSSETSLLRVDATVGISLPTWAATNGRGETEIPGFRSASNAQSGDHGGAVESAPPRPGTINIVVQLAARPEVPAAVNLVMTVTEAKTQALLDAGVPGTGTASDAVAVIWPFAEEPSHVFGGPRSQVGQDAANCTYDAISSSLANMTWLADARAGVQAALGRR